MWPVFDVGLSFVMLNRARRNLRSPFVPAAICGGIRAGDMMLQPSRVPTLTRPSRFGAPLFNPPISPSRLPGMLLDVHTHLTPASPICRQPSPHNAQHAAIQLLAPFLPPTLLPLSLVSLSPSRFHGPRTRLRRCPRQTTRLFEFTSHGCCGCILEGGPIVVYQRSPWDHPPSPVFSPAGVYRVRLLVADSASCFGNLE